MTAIVAPIQARRATSVAWASANPVLRAGEFGVDITTMITKVGDGVTAWASLPVRGYASSQLSDATAAGVAVFTAADVNAQHVALGSGFYKLIGTWAAAQTLGADPASGLQIGDRILVTDIGAVPGAEMMWSGTDWETPNPALMRRTVDMTAVGVASTTEQEVFTMPILAGLLRAGSQLVIECDGWQTNTTLASTTINRLRAGTSATDPAGLLVGTETVTNGTSTRTNAAYSHRAVLMFDGTQARAILTQQVSTAGSTNSSQQTTNVTPPAAAWWLRMTYQSSRTQIRRAVQSIRVTLMR